MQRFNTLSFPASGLLTVLLIFVLSGCNDDVTGPGNGNDNGNGTPGVVEVGMTGNSFVDAHIEVEVGTTVLWINNSNEAHSVTSGVNGEHNGIFNSGNLPPGAEFSFEFTETGTFDYYCIPHWQMGMTGSVTVVDGND